MCSESDLRGVNKTFTLICIKPLCILDICINWDSDHAIAALSGTMASAPHQLKGSPTFSMDFHAEDSGPRLTHHFSTHSTAYKIVRRVILNLYYLKKQTDLVPSSPTSPDQITPTFTVHLSWRGDPPPNLTPILTPTSQWPTPSPTSKPSTPTALVSKPPKTSSPEPQAASLKSSSVPPPPLLPPSSPRPTPQN